MADSEELSVWDNEADRAMHDQKYNVLPKKISNLLDKYIKLPATVLDAGCNIGKWHNAFVNYGFNYVGVDQSPRAIEYALKEYPGSRFICSRLQKFEESEQYDLVFTSAVLQHSKDIHKDFIFCVFHRALKPKGYYLMQENTVKDDSDGYSKSGLQWIDFVVQRGFEIVEYTTPDLYLFQKN